MVTQIFYACSVPAIFRLPVGENFDVDAELGILNLCKGTKVNVNASMYYIWDIIIGISRFSPVTSLKVTLLLFW